MSALVPKADIPRCSEERRYSITSSARCQKRLGDLQPERISRLEVDHQLELGRLLDRQVGWFGAVENLNDIKGRHAA
jgi:hypothetical protein